MLINELWNLIAKGIGWACLSYRVVVTVFVKLCLDKQKDTTYKRG